MKVKELIEVLQRCRNQDAEVFVWVGDGIRLALNLVEPIDAWNVDFVDLNAVTPEGESK